MEKALIIKVLIELLVFNDLETERVVTRLRMTCSLNWKVGW